MSLAKANAEPGHANPNRWVRKLEILATAVLAAGDGNDGVADGVIDDTNPASREPTSSTSPPDCDAAPPGWAWWELDIDGPTGTSSDTTFGADGPPPATGSLSECWALNRCCGGAGPDAWNRLASLVV